MTVAEQALVQVRLDKDLRDEVAGIYAKMGLDIPQCHLVKALA